MPADRASYRTHMFTLTLCSFHLNWQLLECKIKVFIFHLRLAQHQQQPSLEMIAQRLSPSDLLVYPLPFMQHLHLYFLSLKFKVIIYPLISYSLLFQPSYSLKSINHPNDLPYLPQHCMKT